MIVFFVACLSLIFKPVLVARLYVIGLLASQLLRNGCIMTDLENYAKQQAGYQTNHNEFIMSHLLHGWPILGFKIAFVIVIVIQLKEIGLWPKTRLAV